MALLNLLPSNVVVTFPCRNGTYTYEYQPNGPRAQVHDMISQLETICNDITESISTDFIHENKSKIYDRKSSIEAKIKELKAIAEGLANVAEYLCPAIDKVLAVGNQNVGDRMNPVLGFERVFFDFVSSAAWKNGAVILPLRRRLSKPTCGGVARQMLRLQGSDWPLSAGATKRVVKRLESTSVLYKARVLDEREAPPKKVSLFATVWDPEISKLNGMISAARWAYYMTPTSEETVLMGLLDVWWNTHCQRAKISGLLEDFDEWIQHFQAVVQVETTEYPVWNQARRLLADTYSRRFEISGSSADIEAAIEMQLKVLEGSREGATKKFDDSRFLEVYRKMAASQTSALRPSRSESRIHDSL